MLPYLTFLGKERFTPCYPISHSSAGKDLDHVTLSPPSLHRSILEDLDTCELQMAFRGLDEIPNPEVTETRKKIEVFLMAPDTEESQKREVYMNTIMAVAREMTVDEVVYPYRRQAYGYSQVVVSSNLILTLSLL